MGFKSIYLGLKSIYLIFESIYLGFKSIHLALELLEVFPGGSCFLGGADFGISGISEGSTSPLPLKPFLFSPKIPSGAGADHQFEGN